MKYVKKIASFLLAMVMVLGMTFTALAENTTISAPDSSTRTYDVYQIFTGDLYEGILSNVKWGKNGTGTEGQTVEKNILEVLAGVNENSDAEKLKIIQTYVNLDSSALGTVSSENPLTVPTGYYLIKDNGTVNEGETYSLYVVAVVGPTTITPKVSQVTSEKKVIDINDTTGETSEWQDSADYDIGDKVLFQLKGVVADDYDSYTVYKFTFHDEESSGLTDDCTFEVQFEDLKQISSVHAGSVITVEYKSELNNNAVIGSGGNSNTMKLEYSNNPNDKQGGTTGNVSVKSDALS